MCMQAPNTKAGLPAASLAFFCRFLGPLLCSATIKLAQIVRLRVPADRCR